MAMRIREGMREAYFGPLGGEGKLVEADETFKGGKAKNRAYKTPPKEAVMSLVERGGKVRSFHVPEVSATTLKPIIVDAIAKDPFQDRREWRLLADRRRIRQPHYGHSLNWRIRQGRRAHEHC